MTADKPILFYDGDCGFCRRWVGRWRALTGDAVEYRLSERQAEAVWLVQPDGARVSGARAVFAALEHARSWRWLAGAYRRVPGFAPASEAAYHLVASRRAAFSRLDAWLWGKSEEPPSQHLAAALYVRALGLVYLLAFASLGVQVRGLIGERGILPVGDFLAAVAGAYGAGRFWAAPTLLWLGCGDRVLVALCWSGAALGAALMSGLAPAFLLAALWALYLSLTVGGQIFLGYQWDNLLLEAGLLAVFLYPPARRPAEPSRAFLNLTRWLLLRVMFSSGAAKLLSGDAAWRDLSALTYHYMTQPLPTRAAWHAHWLPAPVHRACAAAMFAVELGAPLLAFAPRRPRAAAALAIAALMLAIAVSGNYCFFNLLTAALSLTLLDDQTLRPLLGRLAPRPARAAGAARGGRLRGALAAGLFLASLLPFSATLGLRAPWALEAAVRALEPLRSVNGYGLFAVMTRSRPEISVEGSDDGAEWKAYGFRYKPGDVQRAPSLAAPHQPRLDWQMWFAALGTCSDNPWLLGLQVRLLQGEPAVLALLRDNPFPAAAPRYVRTSLYDYRFSTPAQKRADGSWWRREPLGPYCPPLSLRQGGLLHRRYSRIPGQQEDR